MLRASHGQKVYVFTKAPDGSDCLAGELTSSHKVGTFRYAPGYLAQDWAYPLDPANLPLTANTYTVNNKDGVFGVFKDAGPDDWGTRIMLMNNTHTPQDELERLVRTSGGGVGGLQFSLSRTRPKAAMPLKSIALLDQLQGVTKRILDREKLSPDELALIEPGSFLGGARPKVSVDDGGEAWMIKFPKGNDAVDYCRMEYTCMTFIKKHFGINTPDVKLIDMGNGEVVFAIRRFDKLPGRPVHFISANSLFNVDRLRQVNDSRHNPYSYVNLASILRKHSDRPDDVKELFVRMVANILFGNTDDHANNHAMIYDIVAQTWQLSPAYDVLPSFISQLKMQSLGVGKQGGESSLVNALSLSSLFGLKEADARQIVEDMILQFDNWTPLATELGLDDNAIQMVQSLFNTRVVEYRLHPSTPDITTLEH